MDCADVFQVIHQGPPKLYVQERGPAGRSGSLALAVLILRNRRHRFKERAMNTYITTTSTCIGDILYIS